MKPVCPDTNILARGPLEDDPGQTAIARELLRRAARGPGIVVSAFAILELAWVLKIRKVPRSDVASAIRSLMGSEGVKVSHGEVLLDALERFESGSADLADCMIQADGAAAGAGTFATFDKGPRKETWGTDPEALLHQLRERPGPA